MDSKIMSESLLLLERISNIWGKDAHRWFPFGLGGWMDSSSDEDVMEIQAKPFECMGSLARRK